MFFLASVTLIPNTAVIKTSLSRKGTEQASLLAALHCAYY
jgi:hypothetical protein